MNPFAKPLYLKKFELKFDINGSKNLQPRTKRKQKTD